MAIGKISIDTTHRAMFRSAAWPLLHSIHYRLLLLLLLLLSEDTLADNADQDVVSV